eukprot:COSAG01_NODE_56892_length_315_cov_1.902778_1_plen_38_part_10
MNSHGLFVRRVVRVCDAVALHERHVLGIILVSADRAVA